MASSEEVKNAFVQELLQAAAQSKFAFLLIGCDLE